MNQNYLKKLFLLKQSKLYFLYKIFGFKNYYNIIKIYNILNITNIVFWYLINLFIKKVNNFNIILRYLLLKIIKKNLIIKKSVKLLK